jgi:hypothetical protein
MHTLEDVREHLDFVRAMGTKTGGLFKRYDPNQSSFYAVYVSFPDAIKPAIGKFGSYCTDSLKEARNMKKDAIDSGYHAHIIDWEAYANPDHFCSVTSALLKAPKWRFAYLIFHESYHVHSFFHGWFPRISIHEALADIFAQKAGLDFYSDFPQMRSALTRNFSRDRDFDRIADNLVRRVVKGYRKGLSEGRAALSRAKTDYLIYLGEDPQDKKLRSKIDNSTFLRWSNYASSISPVFDALLSFSAKDMLDIPRVRKAVRGVKNG